MFPVSWIQTHIVWFLWLLIIKFHSLLLIINNCSWIVEHVFLDAFSISFCFQNVFEAKHFGCKRVLRFPLTSLACSYTHCDKFVPFSLSLVSQIDILLTQLKNFTQYACFELHVGWGYFPLQVLFRNGDMKGVCLRKGWNICSILIDSFLTNRHTADSAKKNYKLNPTKFIRLKLHYKKLIVNA